MTDTLADLIYFDDLRSANLNRQQEWDPGDFANNADWRLNELAGEAGELCNILKKLHRERCGVPGSRATAEELADEMADVIICIDLVALTVGHPGTQPRSNVFQGTNQGTLPQFGRLIMSSLGSAASPDVPLYPLEFLHGLMVTLAKRENVNLDRAVAKKFNQTSVKMSLKTRLTVN